MRLSLVPNLSRGTQRTDTATRGSRSASEAAQPLYKLYIGPVSYRLRSKGAEPSRSIFASPPGIEAPHAYVLYLPASELPLKHVFLIPATEASGYKVVLHPVVTPPLATSSEIRLEGEDTRTGETRSVEINAMRYRIDAGETRSLGSIRVGLRHV